MFEVSVSTLPLRKAAFWKKFECAKGGTFGIEYKTHVLKGTKRMFRMGIYEGYHEERIYRLFFDSLLGVLLFFCVQNLLDRRKRERLEVTVNNSAFCSFHVLYDTFW